MNASLKQALFGNKPPGKKDYCQQELLTDSQITICSKSHIKSRHKTCHRNYLVCHIYLQLDKC